MVDQPGFDDVRWAIPAKAGGGHDNVTVRNRTTVRALTRSHEVILMFPVLSGAGRAAATG